MHSEGCHAAIARKAQALGQSWPPEASAGNGPKTGKHALSESSGSQKVQLKLSAQAEKYTRRDAPIEARQMAARGALPLEPIELAGGREEAGHKAGCRVVCLAREVRDISYS